jgi:transcriptional regulator with XRE-family HTH domain
MLRYYEFYINLIFIAPWICKINQARGENMLRVEFERRKRGLTQSQLGKKANVPASDICRIEKGSRPYPTHLKRLSDFFNIPANELVRKVE